MSNPLMENRFALIEFKTTDFEQGYGISVRSESGQPLVSAAAALRNLA